SRGQNERCGAAGYGLLREWQEGACALLRLPPAGRASAVRCVERARALGRADVERPARDPRALRAEHSAPEREGSPEWTDPRESGQAAGLGADATDPRGGARGCRR